MKRVLIAVLVMLMALMGVSASAEENVTALGKGAHGVLFSNGFSGFCINIDRELTDIYGQFVSRKASEVKSQYYQGESIEPYLKTMFIYHHNKFFSRIENGGYYDNYLFAPSKANIISDLVWLFSNYAFKEIRRDTTPEDFAKILNKTGDQKVIPYKKETCEIIADVCERVAKNDIGVANRRYSIDDDTDAVFEFITLYSVDPAVQNYFALKITYYREETVSKDNPAVLDVHIPSDKVEEYEWFVDYGDGEFVPIDPEKYDIDSDGVLTLTFDQEEPIGKRYQCIITDKEFSSKHYLGKYIYDITVLDSDEPKNPPEKVVLSALNSMPQTGDNTNVGFWLSCMVIVCVSFVFPRRRSDTF